MLGITLVFKRACSPVGQCWWLLAAWTLLWGLMLAGAGIMMAIENPTREEPDAISIGQPPMNFLDAVYFTAVYLTSCGIGDIVPLTSQGRAFLCVWSFICTTMWLILVSSIVLFLCDWVYVKIVLNFVWYYTAERYVLQAMRTMSEGVEMVTASPGDASHEQSNAGDDLSASLSASESQNQETGKSTLDDAVNTLPRKRSRYGGSWEEVRARSLNEEVLSWKGLLILNVIALSLYFAVHLFYTGILITVDPELANLDPALTPNSFATAFYASYLFSQTICFGTDYSPKTSDSRAFFVAWQQFNLIAATFLFTTVALSIIRSTHSKLYRVTERLLQKNYRASRTKLFARIQRKHSSTILAREVEAGEDEKQEQLEEAEEAVTVPSTDKDEDAIV